MNKVVDTASCFLFFSVWSMNHTRKEWLLRGHASVNMIQESLVEITGFQGEDFKRLVEYDGWSVAFLRYAERFSRLLYFERHLLTDEVFVLLNGSATLFIRTDEGIQEICMEKEKVYNVRCGVWHQINVSKDATVLVVENRNTAKENTEKDPVM